jgi:hypothetical protein
MHRLIRRRIDDHGQEQLQRESVAAGAGRYTDGRRGRCQRVCPERVPENWCGCILGAFWLAVSTARQEMPAQVLHLGSTDRDATMRCITSIYSKPTLWDRIGTNLLIQPCPATPAELTDVLTKRGIRIFDAQDFMYVVPEKLFQFFDHPQELYPGGPVQAWPTLKWSSITVHLHVQKWSQDEKLPAQANEIAKQIVQQARMIPLAVSHGPSQAVEDDDVNIAIWQGSLGPASEQSVVACINGRGRGGKSKKPVRARPEVRDILIAHKLRFWSLRAQYPTAYPNISPTRARRNFARLLAKYPQIAERLGLDALSAYPPL